MNNDEDINDDIIDVLLSLPSLTTTSTRAAKTRTKIMTMIPTLVLTTLVLTTLVLTTLVLTTLVLTTLVLTVPKGNNNSNKNLK